MPTVKQLLPVPTNTGRFCIQTKILTVRSRHSIKTVNYMENKYKIQNSKLRFLFTNERKKNMIIIG